MFKPHSRNYHDIQQNGICYNCCTDYIQPSVVLLKVVAPKYAMKL